MTTTENRIYVADLKDYNEGHLCGFWLDLNSKDSEDIQTEISDFLKRRTKETNELHEEYAIHDYELPFTISEWPDFDDLVETLEAIEEHGEAYEAYQNNQNGNGTLEHFENSYCTCTDDLKEYAVDSFIELNNIDDHVRSYLDEDHILYNFEIENTTIEYNGTYYIFYDC